jgi:MFS family permease
MARSLLRSKDVRLITLAVGLSAMGDWLALAPLGLHLADSTGSGFALAALMASLWAPSVLLAGPAGRIVDRVEARALLIWVSLAQAVVAAGLALVSGTAAILALTTLIGTGFALAQPAEFALIPTIARDAPIGGSAEARLGAANGLVEFARYAGFSLGPALGGLLAAMGSARLALLANAATFLAVAAFGLVIRARRFPDRAATAATRREDGGEQTGFRALFADRSLATMMTVAFFSLLFMTSNWAAMPFFATEDLNAGATGYGVLLSCWTLGMAFGALGAAPRVPVGALVTVALGATAVQGAGLGAPAVVAYLPLAFLAFFAGGFSHGLKNTLARTLIGIRVPRQMHGRAFASFNALRNGAELIALLGGAVMVSWAGPRLTVMLAGLLSMSVALVGLGVHRRPSPEPASTAWSEPALGESAA